ncbi:hypothetical protein ACQEV2_22585 [Streptomyces sp. CA-251387]|uniref:hypothetical protein n=1 Tax=Streptomyces sp. CA-251387 TaxID=3240064 RepID=UPI003D90E339
MHAPPELTHWDSAFVNFRHFDFPGSHDHGYRWVDVKRFRLPAGPCEDRDLLAALIAHPQFRDTYDGADLWDEPRHGQWWSHRITPDAYEAVDEATATATVRVWATSGAGVPAALDARLREVAYEPIRDATSRYALGALPEDARHDYGPIHIEFHELVLVDRGSGVLSLLVAADD